jgi:hypothetical protein
MEWHMQSPPPDPPISDVCADQHLVTYLRLLTATDPDTDPLIHAFLAYVCMSVRMRRSNRAREFRNGSPANLFRVTLPRLSYFDDFLGDKVICWIIAALQGERRQCLLIRNEHALDFLGAKCPSFQQSVARH